MRLLPAILRPTAIATFTGLSVEQFGALMEPLWAVRPDCGRGRPWALPFGDRVLLVTLAYRTDLTERQPAALFGVGTGTAHRGKRRPGRAAGRAARPAAGRSAGAVGGGGPR